MLRKTKVHSIEVNDDNQDDLDSPDEIETGILAIQDTNIPIQTNGLWEKKSSRVLTTDGSIVLTFEILLARIMPNDLDDLNIKRYVVYQITVSQNTSSMDPQPAKIERRYTDFRNLYLSLKKQFPNEMANVYFPNKVLMGNFSTNLIAERSASFESFLMHVVNHSQLRDTTAFLNFLQNEELSAACQFLDERRHENAIPLLENCFRLLNKIFTDRSRPVLLILCRLVAATTASPIPHHSAERWSTLALNRYDTLCDIDLLPLYIPLLHNCSILWWQKGLDRTPIKDRLTAMSRKGIDIAHSPTLMQAIHKLDPRTETI